MTKENCLRLRGPQLDVTVDAAQSLILGEQAGVGNGGLWRKFVSQKSSGTSSNRWLDAKLYCRMGNETNQCLLWLNVGFKGKKLVIQSYSTQVEHVPAHSEFFRAPPLAFDPSSMRGQMPRLMPRSLDHTHFMCWHKQYFARNRNLQRPHTIHETWIRHRLRNFSIICGFIVSLVICYQYILINPSKISDWLKAIQACSPVLGGGMTVVAGHPIHFTWYPRMVYSLADPFRCKFSESRPSNARGQYSQLSHRLSCIYQRYAHKLKWYIVYRICHHAGDTIRIAVDGKQLVNYRRSKYITEIFITATKYATPRRVHSTSTIPPNLGDCTYIWAYISWFPQKTDSWYQT